MKKKTRKIITIICLLMIIIATLPLKAFATFITDMNSNASFGVVEGSLANYGHELHYANYDGVTYLTFCTQFGNTSPDGSEYIYNGEFLTEYKANRPEYERMAEMIYFGYTMYYGMGLPTSQEAISAACATQQYVWEYVHNNVDGSFSIPSRDSWNGYFMNSGYYADWLVQTENLYNQYHNNVSFNGITKNLTLGENAVLTDTNGVLQHYKEFNQTIDGVNFYHQAGSNELKISSLGNAKSSAVSFNAKKYGLYELLPNGREYDSTSMSNYIHFRFTSGDVQNLIFSNYVDPSWFSVSVKVETGKIDVTKIINMSDNIDMSLINNDNINLSKIKFKLTAKEDILNVVDESVIYEKGSEIGTYNLDANGKLTIDLLPAGIYELQEVETANGLVLDDTKYEITISQEDIKQINIEKVDIENNATVFAFSKTDITGDEELEGATLQVLDNDGNVIDEWISTSNKHYIEGLKVGETYILREIISPDGYVKSTDIEFTVENTKEIQHVTMIDKVLDVTKTDLVSGEEVEGAELKITDKDGNIIDEWTSEKEAHHVNGLEEGETYTLTEVTCPYGYEIAEDIEFTVSYDKETQIVEMKDKPILKSLQVEKIDKDSGNHIKSNKFVFGIYEDEECTKLIKEAGANEYEGTALFSDLRYGTYYIKELKAPIGYKQSDQVVKIEINENGVFADGVSLEENDGVYSFEYYNTLLPLIQTGKELSNNILFVVLGISLVGILGGIILLKKKK